MQATAEARVWVPALWQLEVGNLLLSAQRRKRINDAKRRELAAAAAGLRLHVDRDAVSMTELDDLAAAHGLSACDATYLELAQRRRLPLATLAKGLQKAMVKAGVERADLHMS